jgi:hypothetical protein
MTVPPARSPASSFEIIATAMLLGCLAGAAAGGAIGVLGDREPVDTGLLAAVGLLGGCVLGGLMGTAWCVVRRRRRKRSEQATLAAPPATPVIATLPPPEDRRPGWRTDPAGSGRRLWDGERWTPHVWGDRHRPT